MHDTPALLPWLQPSADEHEVSSADDGDGTLRRPRGLRPLKEGPTPPPAYPTNNDLPPAPRDCCSDPSDALSPPPPPLTAPPPKMLLKPDGTAPFPQQEDTSLGKYEKIDFGASPAGSWAQLTPFDGGLSEQRDEKPDVAVGWAPPTLLPEERCCRLGLPIMTTLPTLPNPPSGPPEEREVALATPMPPLSTL